MQNNGKRYSRKYGNTQLKKRNGEGDIVCKQKRVFPRLQGATLAIMLFGHNFLMKFKQFVDMNIGINIQNKTPFTILQNINQCTSE